jgi:ribosomal-protein-alanine N-acetyltransferase
VLRELTPDDADALLDLRLRNQEFLRPLEPIRPKDIFTLQGQAEDIEASIRERRAAIGYVFGIFEGQGGDLVGRIGVRNVVRGAWQNATLGYYVDEGHGGRGYCTEAVRLATAFAFGAGGLHRVQAAIMPRNAASIRVVQKNGYRLEGRAERYLQINGVWEDHDIFAITREEWP